MGWPLDESHTLQWDIFCRVVDNFGDIGVCWRLCADLASRGQHVRLWVDDPGALQWMAPGALQGNWKDVQVLEWQHSLNTNFASGLTPADVWVEGFGCTIPEEFVQCFKPPVWINLEYLSAEPYVERCHGLPSYIQNGAGKDATKHFFYPGFTRKTGGLLRETDLLQRQQRFNDPAQAAWLAQFGIAKKPGQQLVSLFCYEPAALPALLHGFAHDGRDRQLLVTHGRAHHAVQQALADGLQITFLPPLTQTNFDYLLWACDVNFVRGEDSLVRALWAGKPLVWHIYPQDDDAHHAKLHAFLDQMQASATVRQFHRIWNGLDIPPAGTDLILPDVTSWHVDMQNNLERLLQLDDLTSQLLEFVQKIKIK